MSVASDVVAYGLAAGLSGTAFIATVVVLTSANGPANAAALLAGLWLVLGAAVTGAAIVADLITGPGDGNVVISLVQLALGVFLLALAWQVRPGHAGGVDIAAKMDGLAAKVQGLQPAQAVRLGVGLAVLPKRLVISLLAGAAIGAAGGTAAQAFILGAIYLLVAGLLIWGTLAAYVVGGQRAREGLEAGRAWTLEHVGPLAFGVALIFGLLFAGQGLTGLLIDA